MSITTLYPKNLNEIADTLKTKTHLSNELFFRDYFETATAAFQHGDILPESFLELYLHAYKLKFDGFVFYCGNDRYNQTELHEKAYMLYYWCCKKANVKSAFKERMIQIAISNYMTEWRNNRLDQVRSRIAYQFKADPIELLKLTTALSNGDRLELDYKIMCHFIWQIKRKMHNKPVSNPMMPILYSSNQQIGKSTAIRKLLKPLEGFLLFWFMSELNDARNYPSLSKHFVVFFDEAQDADRTDIDKLKNLVTAETTNARIFYTSSQGAFKQNATFIAATNKPLDYLICDSTGMKRFWQITCPETIDWSVVNSIDYVKLWTEIDENRNEGYITSEDLASLRTTQEQFRYKDNLERYIDQLPCDLSSKPNKEIYADYQSWCEETGEKAKSKNMMTRFVQMRGYIVVAKRKGSTTYDYWEKA